MLRKRSRSHQKDQQNMGQTHNPIPDSYSSNESGYSNSDAFLKQKHKPNSYFNVTGLFVGLNPKNPESDSVRSPTSPLDFKIFSKPTFGNLPIRVNSKPNETIQKSWNYNNKVGLSIIESLEDETKPSSGKILRSSDSKSIIFAPQILNNPSLKTANFDSFDSLSNSLPKNYSTFSNTHMGDNHINKSNPKLINRLQQESPFAKIWSHSLDSGNIGSNSTRLTTRPTNLNPGKDIVASLSASEIELSEDYTCVRKHGPNPKTTHIFGDCILERRENEFVAKSSENEEHEFVAKPSASVNLYNSNDFLSFCYSCKKKLEGEDIYMYRGEKAFCSWNCRSEEILIEEQNETMQKQDSCEEIFETSMFIAA